MSVGAGEFIWRARVYWEDTDGGGVVYYANYLKFMERARTEWLRSMGHSQSELANTFGYVFAVVEVKVNYRKPARLDDELRITCVPVPEGRASIRFRQTISRDDVLLTEGEVRVACVDSRTFRPRPLPDFIKVT
ncbi:MAG: tol-pal system-associated acyl-CoA thioesterase [Pseudomonadota bacterium]